MSKSKYVVRRWVSFPAFYEVDASTPHEARAIATGLAKAFVKLKGLDVVLDDQDCVVADANAPHPVFLYAGDK